MIAALKINIGRKIEIVAGFQHGDAARTRVEPYVEDVRLFAKAAAAAFRTFEAVRQKLGLRPVVPGVGGFSGKDVGDVTHDRGVGNRFIATRAIKYRNRYAPIALTRDAPVRPALKHIAHAVNAPTRMPFYLLDLFQGVCTQRDGFAGRRAGIHRDKPLRRGTKDHWILTSPAMRVAVLVFLDTEQGTGLAQKFDDLRICLKNTQTGKMLDLGRKFARRVDRSVNIEAVFFANGEVVRTVARGGVDAPRSRLAGRFVFKPHIKFNLGVGLAKRYMVAVH